MRKIKEILNKKGKEKITMLTCYDYSFAQILDETGVDIILVGDSLANVILGLEHTKEVCFEEMLNHTKAVSKAVKNALVIADMPYVSYQKNIKDAVYFANQFIQLGKAEGVKIEWFKHCPEVTESLIKNGIPVMGHLGLTPQTVEELGGFKVQGRSEERALEIINQAKILEKIGVFSIVLESIPYKLAKIITETVKVPTIGIGAGWFCDGQVLVLYDLLGIYKKIKPKFVKVYADLSTSIRKAIEMFIQEVKTEKFPTPKESFSLDEEIFKRLLRGKDAQIG
ncbi:MAG: 3-methyl-2-oxobutanoate hydroxymethyltransferase [Candidatus Omnitrophica bacterium 4484_70.1]|nr:MAG: 3-methyl-2-oxobutanoate hydroxymethyltransferase [Candidatus Omnitrophica bacterium 4484_70.1]